MFSQRLISTHTRAAFAAGLLMLTGCTEPNPAFNPDPFLPGECRAGVEFVETFSDFERPETLDVLFVIDDSGDVDDMQRAVADAIPGFIEGLGDADVQVAVATTDGSGRIGLAAPGTILDGCDGNGVQVARSEQSNFEKIVQCNVVQGTTGDAFQQALSVVRGLFFDASPQDIGFFRGDASLSVIIISNEDDCSSTEVLTASGQPRQTCLENEDKLVNVKLLVDELRQVSTTPEGMRLAVISGPPAQSEDETLRAVCSSSIGASYSATRMYEAVSGMGVQGRFDSLCAEDLQTTFQDLARDFITPKTATLCASKTMAHEPLAVTAVTSDSRTAIRLGEDGFVFLGKTETCSNGALRFAAAAVNGLESVEMKYCVETE